MNESGSRVLTDEDARELWEEYQDGARMRDVASWGACSASTLRRAWRQLGLAIGRQKSNQPYARDVVRGPDRYQPYIDWMMGR